MIGSAWTLDGGQTAERWDLVDFYGAIITNKQQQPALVPLNPDNLGLAPHLAAHCVGFL